MTTAEAKTHLRVTGSDEDTYIAGLVGASRLYCESLTGQVFIERTMLWTLDEFPSSSETALILPTAPVQQIDSIVYTGNDGMESTWDSSLYILLTDRIFPRLLPAYGESWPSDVRDIAGAVKINFTGGFEPGDSSPPDYAENVPEAIKHAMKLVIGHLYEHRMEASRDVLQKMPLAAEHLLSPYKIMGF